MAKQLENLLGEYLIRREGEKEEKISVNSLCGKDKIIGIYFSANWCPPCRGFTPLLSDFYKNLKQKDGDIKFEVVFVSWDRDEASFKEYFSTMPWLALPFEDKKDGEVDDKGVKSKVGTSRKRKGKLCKKYRVQGIPKLVILDGETGKTITCDGYARLMDDKNGTDFPWRQKHFLEVIKGKLIKPTGEEVEAVETLKGKFTAVYFSAHWCPPCRAFTPELLKTYEKLKSDGKNIEVVFVTSDRSLESFNTYFETMPWLAVPYGDSRIDILKEIFGIDGIPTVVMIGETGEIITLNGRTAINFDRDGQEFPWYPKPLNELTECAAIQLNESACLVLFTEGEDEDIDYAKTVLEDLAREESQKGDDQDLFFFYGTDEEICDSVREFASLGENCPLLVILDFPEQEVYVCPETNITKDIAKDFIQKYFNGTLESRNLR